MRLKSLELYGFKSFADKIKLEFKDDFVAIVGPNGSGKSNISDAVRWVLGEQSARSLRGDKMEDIIFSGGKDKAPMNLAQVDMIFDNSDGLIRLPYEELSVSRKLYRSGESIYQINKSKVRRKDVYELFLDTGIGKEGYSIIGQGRIDEILSSKSEDRRAVFEEAAGIAKYKYKKQDSLRRLEKTSSKLDEIESQLKIKDKEEELLKKQAENAKRALELLKDLDSQELSLLKKNLENSEKKLKNIGADIEKGKADKLELEAALDIVEEKLAPFANFIENYDREKNKLEETSRFLEREINKAENEKNILQEKINFYQQDLQRSGLDKERRDGERAQLEKDLSLANKNFDDLRAEKSQLKESLDKMLAQEKGMENFNLKIEGLQKEIDNLRQDISILDFKKERDRERDRENSRVKDEEKLKIEKFKKEIEQIEDKDRNLEKELQNADEMDQDALKRIEEIKEELITLSSQAADNDHKLNNYKNELASASSRQKILKSLIDRYEGYRKPVQQLLLLAKSRPDIRKKYIGPLADLIRVKEGFETAIDYCLGPALQNVVVKNEEDAKYLIQILKEKNIGRVTFLPISKIQGGKNLPGLFPEEICSAMEALEYDGSIKNILSHFLANTSIVNDIDTALALSRRPNYKKRIVSLDGDIINSWGSMVGGKNIYKQETSLFNRNKELEKLELAIADFNDNIKDLEKRIQENLKTSRSLTEEREEIFLKREKLVKYKQQIKEEKLANKYMKEACLENIDRSQRILAEVFEFSEEAYEYERKDLFKALSDKEKEIAFYKDKDMQAGLEGRELEKKIALLKQKDEIYDRDLALGENKVHEISEKINSLDQTLKLLFEEEEANKDKINHGLEKLKSLSDKIEKMTPQMAETEKEILLLSKQYKLQSSDLSKLNEEKSSYKEKLSDINNQLYRLLLAEEQIQGEMTGLKEDYRSQYDLSYEEVDNRLAKLIPVECSKNRINEIKKALSFIGYFNVDTIDQYEDLFKELTFLREQMDDLTKSKEDIEALIKDLDKKMLDLFNEHFDKINSAYDLIFKKLFRGGRARIYLDGQDPLSAGVEIEAQPPGKKLQSLNLLSGGERSMTALALLFAIFSIRPTPFCILDEIDASLDETNIARYIDYLKTLTDKTQFIVITHRKRTMELAQLLYGITMDKGVSRMIYLRLDDYKEEGVNKA